MSIDAIRGLNFKSNYSMPKANKAAEEPKEPVAQPAFAGRKNVSNDAMRNATKGMLVGLVMLPAAASMNSCSTEAEAWASAWAEANANDSCCHCHHGNIISGKDTITVHDTIKTIIERVDTIKVKEKLDSPIFDALKDWFETNGINTGDKRIPILFSWVDEMDNSYNKFAYDDDNSSKNEKSYRGARSPWSDDEGKFVIGTVLDKPSLMKYSINSDGKLLMMRYVPKNGVANPKNQNDWMYSNAAVYDINKGGHVVTRYDIASDNSEVYKGTFRPGDIPKSILVKNNYDTDWRYSNVKVEMVDPEEVIVEE